MRQHPDMQCPYCGDNIYVNHDDGFGYAESVAHEQQCTHCNQLFVFYTSVSYHYEPHKAYCLNTGLHQWKRQVSAPRWAAKLVCRACDIKVEIPRTESGAEFSPCHRYRYTLWRIWDKDKPFVNMIGLNPSTADETKNDPTITRCINYAKSWGYGGLLFTNLFAFRATQPYEMKAALRPISEKVKYPEVDKNDEAIRRFAASADLVVAAWGTHGAYLKRGQQIVEMLTELVGGVHCLKITKDGHPSHPLYLSQKLTPIIYTKPEIAIAPEPSKPTPDPVNHPFMFGDLRG